MTDQYLVSHNAQGRVSYLDANRGIWVRDRDEATPLTKQDANWAAFQNSTRNKRCRVIPARP